MMIKNIFSLLLFILPLLATASPSDIEDGYNYQIQKNNADLMKSKLKLDKTFNFEKLAKDNILPPSVSCNKKNHEMVCVINEQPKSLYKNSSTKILLTWEDFLIVPIPEVHIIVKDNEDFQLGKQKALQLLKSNFNKLEVMYFGMVQFRSLGVENSVSFHNK